MVRRDGSFTQEGVLHTSPVVARYSSEIMLLAVVDGLESVRG